MNSTQFEALVSAYIENEHIVHGEGYAKGLKYLSSGAFTKVFTVEDFPEIVFKVTEEEVLDLEPDPGILFAMWAKINKDKYIGLPEVYHATLRVVGEFRLSFVVMRRYECTIGNLDDFIPDATGHLPTIMRQVRIAIESLREFHNGLQEYSRSVVRYNWDQKNPDPYYPAEPPVRASLVPDECLRDEYCDMLDALFAEFPMCRQDLHRGNAMTEKQLWYVVTDPIAGWAEDYDVYLQKLVKFTNQIKLMERGIE